MSLGQHFTSAIRVLLDRMYWGWLPNERLVAIHVGRKAVGVLMYWLGFAAALTLASAIIAFGTKPDPNGWGFIFGLIFIIPLVTSLHAAGVVLAQFALPTVGAESAPKFRKASFVTGLVLAVPLVFGFFLLRSLELVWIAGPALAGISYFLILRLLHTRGWFRAARDGRCAGCGYILVAGTSALCPECGRSVPSN